MYNTLLVPVDGRSRSTRSVELACRIARMFDAHVIGLFVTPSTYIPSPVLAEGGAELLQELQDKMTRELTEGAKMHFDAGVKASGTDRAEWRTAEGDRAEAVALHARYADLVVLNQTDPSATDASHFADSVLLSVGRPMLLVPYTGEMKTFGQNVLVCWNASREAARAVTDALPLLTRAAKVSVMCVDDRDSPVGHDRSPGADIALFLARHGVKAKAERTVSSGMDIGDVILSRAFDAGADLIVMGGYGHSRVREIVLGGATRTVLRSMTAPVLMSH